jgi:hypothetical protein
LFEAENLAALRIDAGHDVLDRAVLACGVHRLKNQQQRMAVVGVEQTLPRAQFPDVRFEDHFVILLRFVEGLYPGRPLFESDRFALAYAELFGFDFHVRAHPWLKNATAGRAHDVIRQFVNEPRRRRVGRFRILAVREPPGHFKICRIKTYV